MITIKPDYVFIYGYWWNTTDRQIRLDKFDEIIKLTE